MAKQIYSFTKIEKKKTNSGVITTVIGAVTILALIGLVVAAVVMGGNVPLWMAGVGVFTLIAALAGLIIARESIKDDDVFGRCLNTGKALCGVSLGLHFFIVIVGILAIVM